MHEDPFQPATPDPARLSLPNTLTPPPPPAHRTPVDVSDVRITPDGFVLCGCPCECASATTVPVATITTSAARILADHTRCSACTARGHHDQPDPIAQADLTAAALTEHRHARHRHALTVWAAQVKPMFADATSTPGTPGGPASAAVAAFLTDRLARYAANAPAGFIAGGPFGTGKTWLAWAFLNDLVTSGAVHPSEILHGSETRLLSPISMGSFTEVADARSNVFDPTKRVVFIDDVGQGNFRDARAAQSIWHELTDELWSNNRTLIITTNLTLTAAPAPAGAPPQPSQFEQWIGAAAFDRVVALTGGNIQIMGTDTSTRRANARAADNAWQPLQLPPTR